MGGPHHGLPVLERGQPAERAAAAMLLLHGRGATAEDIDEPSPPPATRGEGRGGAVGTRGPFGPAHIERSPPPTSPRAAGGGHLDPGPGDLVEIQLYPGMAHVVSADEIAHVRRLMAALTRRDQVERPAPS